MSNSTPLFSVITAVYNRADTATLALKSLVDQTEQDYEAIIVDDGSVDGSGATLRNLFPDFIHLEQENQGPAAARNFGLEHAKGQYIVFLDSDDFLYPWALEVYKKLILDQGRPSFILSKWVEFEEKLPELSLSGEKITSTSYNYFFESSDLPLTTGCPNMIIKKNVEPKRGWFSQDRINAEDSELALRLGMKEGFIVIHSPVTVAYRRHLSSETQSKQGLLRTVKGVKLMIAREKSDSYPGGVSMLNERLNLITRHVRSTSVACVKAGEKKLGWQLYCASFNWHVRLKRWKYLFSFPLLLCKP